MPTPETLANGGVAVVILGAGMEMPKPYAFHPQLLPVSARELDNVHDLAGINRRVPSNTRIVFVAGELAPPAFFQLKTALHQRQVPYVQRRNPEGLQAALAASLPAHVEKVVDAPSPLTDVTAEGVDRPMADPQPKGTVAAFVAEHVDIRQGSAAEARRLHPLALQAGIQTTVGSLAQAISIIKRKRNAGETPRSVMSAQQKALSTLDEAITGLQLVREYVADTEKLNVELQNKVQMFKGLAAKLMEE